MSTKTLKLKAKREYHSVTIAWDHRMKAEEAMKDPKWLKSMQRQTSQLAKENAWQLVKKTKNTKLLPGIWQFKESRDDDGNVKHEARWRVKGSNILHVKQQDNACFPLAKESTIRVLFAIAAHVGCKVTKTMNLGKDVYVVQPIGFEDPQHREKVCKLNSPLCGITMSRHSYDSLSSQITSKLGYQRSHMDPALFFRHCSFLECCTSIIVICKDCIMYLNIREGEHVLENKTKLDTMWKLQNLDESVEVLNMRVVQDENITYLDQIALVEVILRTPWVVRIVNTMAREERKEKHFKTIQMLRSLASGTRPDISFAVDQLDVLCPSLTEWTKLEQLHRYLDDTKYYVLRYERSVQHDSLDLHGFADASFRTNLSIMGFVIKLANGPVYWMSHDQEPTAASINDAEYKALSEAAMSTLDIYFFIFLELHLKIKLPTLYEDNTGAIMQASKWGMIHIEHIRTDQQVADLLTKGWYQYLVRQELISTMGLVDHATRGKKKKKS